MSTPVKPEITAEISLVATVNGGRDGPLRHGEYRGVLAVGSENFSFRCFIPSESGFGPDQAQTIGIQFLFPEMALPLFPVGAEFTIWEGGTIGHGKVVSVLNQG